MMALKWKIEAQKIMKEKLSSVISTFHLDRWREMQCHDAIEDGRSRSFDG